MFHRHPNATKAAYGQTLLHLKERGFSMVDTGMVPDHMLNYGSRYIPSWQFEEQLRTLIHQPRTITDGVTTPLLPTRLAWKLPFARITRGIKNRLRRNHEFP
jgi:hypothetical protein